jgi:4-alpha-glucanotransferase
MITPEVEALRQQLGVPGMKVIQFGFSGKGAHIYLPHQFTEDMVAYTGTHDNDTTLGWWKVQSQNDRAAVEAYVGAVNERPAWPMMRAAAASLAQIAIAPAQDLLELGSEARMNTPAVAAGNWSWRAPEESWKPEMAAALAAMVDVTDRDNDPIGDPMRSGG